VRKESKKKHPVPLQGVAEHQVVLAAEVVAHHPKKMALDKNYRTQK
jgi:hypothetical protein